MVRSSKLALNFHVSPRMSSIQLPMESTAKIRLSTLLSPDSFTVWLTKSALLERCSDWPRAVFAQRAVAFESRWIHPDSALRGSRRKSDDLFATSFERETKRCVMESRRRTPMRHWEIAIDNTSYRS